MFGHQLDETVHYVQVCGEDINISENFIYLGKAVHNDGVSSQEVVQRVSLTNSVIDSFSFRILKLLIPVQTDDGSNFQVAVDPCLTLWLLNMDTEN